ncbi:Hsp70 family protein [Gordonia sp. NPDC003585]|uniref:Hsp70 family protein n=1 Tax=unclassified Gordonia (in: high G+C Gram-positive bacteria) TaxID=2657482 RepID=UPI0033AFC856
MPEDVKRRLCIDFGTSNTAAAYRVGVAEPVVVPLSREGVAMPSAVFADGDSLSVGAAAIASRLQRPDAFEGTPKSRIAEGEVELGDRFWPVEDLIGAVLRHVHHAALRHSGLPAFDSVVLTHPDKWSERRKRVLRHGAERGGIRPDQIRLASESLAAAWYYVYRGHDVSPGERMCVFDFGAGTCDVAVLMRDTDGSFTVVGSGGDNYLGGRDFDVRLLRWVSDEAAELDPALPERLRGNANQLILAEKVRMAKEALSENSQAAIELPDVGRSLLLTRREFESMVAPFVERATELTREAIKGADAVQGAQASDKPSERLAVYVTGGTSSIPAVQAALSAVGRVARIGDPKVVVAQGGLLRSTNVEVPASAAISVIGAARNQAGNRITFPQAQPGSMVSAVHVRNGQPVRTGAALATVDMPSGRAVLEAPCDGVVDGVNLRPGVPVSPGAVFMVIGPPDLPHGAWASLHRVPARFSSNGGRPAGRAPHVRPIGPRESR